MIETIADLSNQTHKSFEIIVIDQTDDQLFMDISKIDQRIIQFRSNIPSASHARNLGLKLANFEVVLFLDDDVVIENKDYIRNILNHFNRGSNGVVGPILDYTNPKKRFTRHRWSFNKNWGWLFFPRNYFKRCKINDGGAGNLTVKRAFAIEVGGMDENFIKGAHREESDFNMRYTEKYGWYDFEPDCSIVHIGRATGGVRTWNNLQSTALKAQHHYDGAFYFLFKNVKLWHWPPHILSILIFFFLHKELFIRPLRMLKAVFRASKGKFNAIRLLMRGPQYIR